MVPHIVIDITGHGYGHLGQTAPVVQEVRRLAPQARFTVRTSIPRHMVESFLGGDCRFADAPPEIGLAMTSPVDVDAGESARYYSRLHADWADLVKREAGRLAALAPRLLVSNVGYVGLAAAAAIGLPAIAMSSLNWADIYRRYCGDRPEAPAIHAQMLDAYHSAALFLQFSPHLPMADLPNRVSLGPVARVGRDQRRTLAEAIGAGETDRFALASLGGIKGQGGIGALPRVPGLRWLAAPELAAAWDGVVSTARVDLPFIDILRSCDVVVTKPGYGMIVESVCNGTRVVCCERPDWPETPVMGAWARSNGIAATVSREALATGGYGQDLRALLERPDPAPVPPTGAAEAARLIVERCG